MLGTVVYVNNVLEPTNDDWLPVGTQCFNGNNKLCKVDTHDYYSGSNLTIGPVNCTGNANAENCILHLDNNDNFTYESPSGYERNKIYKEDLHDRNYK